MKKFAYIIRVLTLAPLMALVMLLILYFRDPSFFGSFAVFILAVIFLVVFPLLAYLPSIKTRAGTGSERLHSFSRWRAMYSAVF
jgi:hypothetical protein